VHLFIAQCQSKRNHETIRKNASKFISPLALNILFQISREWAKASATFDNFLELLHSLSNYFKVAYHSIAYNYTMHSVAWKNAIEVLTKVSLKIKTNNNNDEILRNSLKSYFIEITLKFFILQDFMKTKTVKLFFFKNIR